MLKVDYYVLGFESISGSYDAYMNYRLYIGHEIEVLKNKK